MKKIINLVLIIILCQTSYVFSQSTIEAVIKSVKTNNKLIQVSKQKAGSSKLSAKTGIYLENPEVEYIHKFGSIETGNIQEINISQSFDFPTVYSRQKNQANLISQKADLQHKAEILEILFETQNTCIELVFFNKRKNILTKRINHANKNLSMLERQEELGSMNILEINKAKILVLGLQTEYDLTNTNSAILTNTLIVLNGNIPIVFNDSVYQTISEKIILDSIKNQAFTNNPQQQINEIEKQIAKSQKQITKARNLPAFSLGYSSEFTKNDNFHGFMIGMSIPLWENKNTIKYENINILTVNAVSENYEFENNMEIEQTYAEFVKYHELYVTSTALYSEIENERLLQIAYEQGEISGLNYFSEIAFFYQAVDNLLLVERELYLSYSKLMKNYIEIQ